MGLIWPEDTNFADKELNHVQEVVKKLVGEKTLAGEKTSVPRFTITPEDHRKHLDLIQTVIARQSSASASAKSWLLPIITATFGFALTQESWGLGAIGAVVIILFALLDANYLHSERLFRNLYAEVIRPGNQVPLYSLNPLDVPAPDSATEKATRESRKKPRRSSLPPWSAWSSWSIAPVYSALLIMSLVVMFAASNLNISSLIRVLTEFIC